MTLNKLKSNKHSLADYLGDFDHKENVHEVNLWWWPSALFFGLFSKKLWCLFVQSHGSLSKKDEIGYPFVIRLLVIHLIILAPRDTCLLIDISSGPGDSKKIWFFLGDKNCMRKNVKQNYTLLGFGYYFQTEKYTTSRCYSLGLCSV